MAVGVLLSMWISNSGVTAMLIPIVDAVVDELFHVTFNRLANSPIRQFANSPLKRINVSSGR